MKIEHRTWKSKIECGKLKTEGGNLKLEGRNLKIERVKIETRRGENGKSKKYSKLNQNQLTKQNISNKMQGIYFCGTFQKY